MERIPILQMGDFLLVTIQVDMHDQLALTLQHPLAEIPAALADLPLELAQDGTALVYTFDAQAEHTGIATLLRRLGDLGIGFKDLHSSESSLEDIFVSLVHADPRDGGKETGA